jgi:DNA adenine methylase
MIGPLSYIGGKHRLAKKIISLLPEHLTYVEPFAGGAQVLFHKPPSKVEVLNDIDGEIVNFFRVCQFHHEELIRYMRFMVVSRDWYSRLRATPPATLTDVQRACRYFYIQKNSFGGRVARPNYAFHVIQPARFESKAMADVIAKTHERLAHVQIESLPYEQILQKYDRPTTVFFLDPPYFGKNLYNFNFEPAHFDELALRLRVLKGRFILSLNDTPEVRSIFRGFRIESVQLAYSAQKKAGRRYAELIIRNGDA